MKLLRSMNIYEFEESEENLKSHAQNENDIQFED
jgi:hypothetical protein